MRYPYEVLLAGIAGILEFIPVVGPASAAIIMVLVCAVTGSGGLIWIVVFFALYRVFADYVLSPYLMSAGIETSSPACAVWSFGRRKYRRNPGNVLLGSGDCDLADFVSQPAA